MRKLAFSKMHGIGNDYIYFNCLKECPAFPPALIAELCDRHFGIGGDGIVLIVPSRTHDFGMRMFNADGSEAEMCGNAVRCVAKYLYDKGITSAKKIDLETKAGLIGLELSTVGGKVAAVRVDMGEPVFESSRIPVSVQKERVIGESIEEAGHALKLTCVSMGNPHAVFVVPEITDELVLGLGPKIERHPIFPARTNVEFVRVVDKQTLEMRVWERGSGETLACGTGACATAVAGVLNGRTDRKVELELLGGRLRIEWREADGHVRMTGGAEFVFDGVWLKG